MEYRRLGSSGLQVSALSLGSWLTFGAQIDDATAEALMIKAYDNGVNFFDNAEIYAEGKSEEVMGKILHRLQWDRSSYTVSSKVFFGDHRQGPNQKGLSRKHVIEACHAALRRLKVEYLDMYFCHRPDRNVPIEETVWSMHQLIMQGKVLYWGTSEWSAQEITEAHLVARQHHLIGPTMEQPQYNMLHRQKVEIEYDKLYKDFGMGTTIWSPLSSGLLTGKYNQMLNEDSGRLSAKHLAWLSEKNLTADRLEKAAKISDLAKELGVSSAQLAVAWCLKNPNVSTVILGASKMYQLEDTLQSLKVVPLIINEIEDKIEAILQNKPIRQL